ncbi:MULTISPECIES: hypothetical protein [Burkholderia]|uniref:Uncharacterized protein n=1 Tax=Burkholderia theae TaxID=3143496 RepID=A0ABU9WKL0_9BURK|nr:MULTISPECIES: hypothetical protein [Burkholderia]
MLYIIEYKENIWFLHADEGGSQTIAAAFWAIPHTIENDKKI